MTQYKAIISDIDGTIAPLEWHAKPSEKVKKAIQEVQQNGFKFCLATGKPFYLIEHLIDELKITSPIIIDNGAAIYDTTTKEPLWDSTISIDRVKGLFTFTKKYAHQRIRISVGKESFDVEELTQEYKNIRKVLIMGMLIKDAESLIKETEEKYKDLAIVRAQAHEGDAYLDVYITDLHATKQHAVEKLAEILGIETSAIIGIGDHYNDFPLLMACGFKVAMGNAVDDLKAIADYVAPSVEEDGVVDVIERFVQ